MDVRLGEYQTTCVKKNHAIILIIPAMKADGLIELQNFTQVYLKYDLYKVKFMQS